jgi:predicted nucleotidyltransferase
MSQMALTPHGIEIPPAEIETFCARNHIRKLSLFGSILTDRFGPESDVDVLVEFEPGAAITFLDVARMEREFSKVVGRKVDLRTPQDLSRYFRERVVSEALVQYERE